MINTLEDTTLTSESRLKEILTLFMKSRLNCNGDEMDIGMGYPVPFKMDLEYSKFYEWYSTLDPKYKIIFNNAGDPDPGFQKIYSNSHEVENYVVQYFASRLGFKIFGSPSVEKAKDGEMHWGFISASGTDGNNHGIYYGRKYLASHQPSDLKKVVQPVVYLSREAHYSNKRMADLQNLECIEINTCSATGSLKLSELEVKIDGTKPVIVVATIGTTMRGGIDDVAAIYEMLKKKCLPLGYYIHVDAALFGGYLMFSNPEAVSVKKLGYHSISISGHKFFGCDDPCGIFVTTREIKECVLSDPIPYLSGCIPTLSCSRSGTTALKLYFKLSCLEQSEWINVANQCLRSAKLLFDMLKEKKCKVWRMSELSNTIVIAQPSTKIIHRYQLASSEYEPYGGKISHIVVMQHVNKELITRFVEDMFTQK